LGGSRTGPAEAQLATPTSPLGHRHAHAHETTLSYRQLPLFPPRRRLPPIAGLLHSFLLRSAPLSPLHAPPPLDLCLFSLIQELLDPAPCSPPLPKSAAVSKIRHRPRILFLAPHLLAPAATANSLRQRWPSAMPLHPCLFPSSPFSAALSSLASSRRPVSSLIRLSMPGRLSPGSQHRRPLRSSRARAALHALLRPQNDFGRRVCLGQAPSAAKTATVSDAHLLMALLSPSAQPAPASRLVGCHMLLASSTVELHRPSLHR
jgi:hypothetical protein